MSVGKMNAEYFKSLICSVYLSNYRIFFLYVITDADMQQGPHEYTWRHVKTKMKKKDENESAKHEEQHGVVRYPATHALLKSAATAVRSPVVDE